MKLRIAPICLVVCIPVCMAETAPEAVAVDADGHRIALENAYVRVLELRAEPGHRIPLHTHPPHAVVVLVDFDGDEFLYRAKRWIFAGGDQRTYQWFAI